MSTERSEKIRAALFILVAPNWKQPKCPSREEDINEDGNVHTVEHYFATKKNEVLICAVTWMSLKINMLNERSETEKIEKNTVLSI